MNSRKLPRQSDALRALGFAKRKKKSELRSALRRMLADVIHFPSEVVGQWPYKRESNRRATGANSAAT